MIAKGNPHNSGPRLGRYLLHDSGGNERTEVGEVRGFATSNLNDALSLGQLLAEGTRAENPFFHVQVRSPKDEHLTREQWAVVADRIEAKLGFDDQPRALVFHAKGGQEHLHIVWSRIDTDRMQAIDPGLYKNKLKEVCRELEQELGLQLVRNSREPEEKARAAARNEFEQARRLNSDLKAIRENIRGSWERSDNGPSFAASLRDQGLILARGDRRSYVVIDADGGIHALSKRITGATAKETRSRLEDLDYGKLPTINDARAELLERAIEKQDQPGGSTEAGPAGQDGQRITGPDSRSRGGDIDLSPTLSRASHTVGRAADRTGSAAARLGDGLAKAAERALDLLVGSPAPDRSRARAEPTRKEIYEARAKELERGAAIDRMRKKLNPEDLRYLNQEELQDIKSRGSEALDEIIRRRDEELERQRSRGDRER